MEKFTIDEITLTVFFDNRRAKNVPEHESEKDLVLLELRYPVKYRVNYNRKRHYVPSGIDLTEDQWKVLPTTKKRELIETRELIQSGFDKVKDHIKEMVKGDGFSFEGLTKRLSKGRKDSILVAFDNKIEELTKAGQIGTASTYQCAINSISKYTTRDLKFSDITVDWLRKYESHLLGEDKTRTTIKFYIGCIRAIMNEAIQDNLITNIGYPFGPGKFKIKKGAGRKLALSLTQISKVLNHPLLTENEKRMRDLWFFSYLCNGINFSDMLKLKYRNIAGGEIHFIRQKTIRTTDDQKEITATILPEMQKIIKRWGNPDRKPDNYIFPFLSKDMDPTTEKKTIQNVIRLCNKKMAEISKALKYDTISTYTARHSYATVLKRSGANIAFISESLGHSDLRTTENYLSSFESDERAKNAALLTKFGKK